MTLNDFSHGFDLLLNSYALVANSGSTDNPATIELNEYEKSLFLTQSQEQEVLDLYSGRNASNAGFEQTEELRRYLSDIVKEKTLSPIETSDGKPLGVESSSKFFTLPEDLWFITYESVHVANAACEGKKNIAVYPVRQDEYHRLKNNPFRGTNDRRALRLDLSEGIVEIVCKYDVDSYYVRYLHKLKPIILVDLSEDNLSINGYSTPMECELHESIHQRILDRAVAIALQSRGYTRNNTENR